jgi:hypothetical protein
MGVPLNFLGRIGANPPILPGRLTFLFHSILAIPPSTGNYFVRTGTKGAIKEVVRPSQPVIGTTFNASADPENSGSEVLF